MDCTQQRPDAASVAKFSRWHEVRERSGDRWTEWPGVSAGGDGTLGKYESIGFGGLNPWKRRAPGDVGHHDGMVMHQAV